jgi:hypothetical protein
MAERFMRGLVGEPSNVEAGEMKNAKQGMKNSK